MHDLIGIGMLMADDNSKYWTMDDLPAIDGDGDGDFEELSIDLDSLMSILAETPDSMQVGSLMMWFLL